MKRHCCLSLGLAVMLSLFLRGTASAAEESLQTQLKNARRVLFLGDSITAAGQYVGYFETWVVGQRWEHPPVIINAGLPSETVSGLSEEGHAGGKFPRPDLGERLERILKVAKPDLVIACYGMNCAIYQPFDQARLENYQAGLKSLREKAAAVGAKVIHITPPFYDDLRSPKPFSYNEVLDRYTAWLLSQRTNGWTVIDLHTPMTNVVREQRKTDPKFTLQPDGVHPNGDGHWLIAQQLMAAFSEGNPPLPMTPDVLLEHVKLPKEALGLIQQRCNLLRDAYVAAAGHLRPGVAKGLPLEEAEQKAAELSSKLAAMMAK